tara:strand:- start:98856 stop:100598 length:1743 start_codon:yes stop_codon:yes gene_type:complete
MSILSKIRASVEAAKVDPEKKDDNLDPDTPEGQEPTGGDEPASGDDPEGGDDPDPEPKEPEGEPDGNDPEGGDDPEPDPEPTGSEDPTADPEPSSGDEPGANDPEGGEPAEPTEPTDPTEPEGDNPEGGDEPTGSDDPEAEGKKVAEQIFESAALDEASKEILDANEEVNEIKEEIEELDGTEASIEMLTGYRDVAESAMDSPTGGISVETARAMRYGTEGIVGKACAGDIMVSSENFNGDTKRSLMTQNSVGHFTDSIESAQMSAWTTVNSIMANISSWLNETIKLPKIYGDLVEQLDKHTVANEGEERVAPKYEFNMLQAGGELGNILDNLKVYKKVAKEILSDKKDIEFLKAILTLDYKDFDGSDADEKFEKFRAALLDILNNKYPTWKFADQKAPNTDRTREAERLKLTSSASPLLMGNVQILSFKDETGASTIEAACHQGLVWHKDKSHRVKSKQTVKLPDNKTFHAILKELKEILKLIEDSKMSEELNGLKRDVKVAVASYKQINSRDLSKGNTAEYNQLNRTIRNNIQVISVTRTMFVNHTYSMVGVLIDYLHHSLAKDVDAHKDAAAAAKAE